MKNNDIVYFDENDPNELDVDFNDLLVKTFTGNEIEDFEISKQIEIKAKCNAAYDNFIIKRGQEKFGDKVAHQICDFLSGHDNPATIADIEQKVVELHFEFMEEMGRNNSAQRLAMIL